MAKFILKDQRGNDQLFDHDKIFVQGENGELVQFTEGEGDTPAVVQPLEVTENGTYTAPDGVDGFNQVVVSVPEPEIKLQDKTITENGEYTADAGFDGLAKVLVEITATGKTPVIKKGAWYRSSDGAEAKTLTHDLGVVPDLVAIFPSYPETLPNEDGLIYAIGSTSQNFFNYRNGFAMRRKSGVVEVWPMNYSITTGYNLGIKNATETTVKIDARVPGVDYYWCVIGGLS